MEATSSRRSSLPLAARHRAVGYSERTAVQTRASLVAAELAASEGVRSEAVRGGRSGRANRRKASETVVARCESAHRALHHPNNPARRPKQKASRRVSQASRWLRRPLASRECGGGRQY